MLGNPSDEWREILREAVGRNQAPVLGTHFRSVVDSVLSGRMAPRPDDGGLRFIQVLERFPDVVSILRRPGQDFLVAPADKKELLSGQAQGRLFRIRYDFFQAFTLISQNRPFFDKTSGHVVWQEPGQVVPDSLVPIQPTDIELEIKLRRDFAEKVGDPQRSALLETLGVPLPLQAFGMRVKDLGLQIQWHRFRTERVVERMQSWASESGIEWKDAWLASSLGEREKSQHDLAVRGQNESMPRGSVGVEALERLLSGLNAADVQRISIPLDLVLKAFSASKR
jgi:hypothetical protein